MKHLCFSSATALCKDPNQASPIILRLFPCHDFVNLNIQSVRAPHWALYGFSASSSAPSSVSAMRRMPLAVFTMVFSINPRGVGFLGMNINFPSALPPKDHSLIQGQLQPSVELFLQNFQQHIEPSFKVSEPTFHKNGLNLILHTFIKRLVNYFVLEYIFLGFI